MCTLIYATLSSTLDLARLPPGGVVLSPADDASVSARLRPGEQLCDIGGVPRCGGGGHCGTVLGREALGPARNSEERTAAQAARLRKKGWSEHKVQAWLAQKRETRAAFERKDANPGVDEHALWQEFLRAALEESSLRYVGLLVFYAGDEPTLPSRSEDVTRAEFDLTRMERGVLYRFHR